MIFECFGRTQLDDFALTFQFRIVRQLTLRRGKGDLLSTEVEIRATEAILWLDLAFGSRNHGCLASRYAGFAHFRQAKGSMGSTTVVRHTRFALIYSLQFFRLVAVVRQRAHRKIEVSIEN